MDQTQGQEEQSDLKLAYDPKKHQGYKYFPYLPVYDNATRFPSTEPFEYTDRGAFANKAKANLFPKDNMDITVTKLTPPIGTEIRGLQLSKLSEEQRNELALLVAERGVVVFRDQDFRDIGWEKQKEFASYFGPLHIHNFGAHVANHPYFHNIYLGPDNTNRLSDFSKESKLTRCKFHSDGSFENQPPGITMLTMLTVPPTGGDTAWVSQVAAYERLSEPMKRFLEGLKAEHNGIPSAERAKKGGRFVRREAIRSLHPIVRIHPATGQKALFVNPIFTKRIIGLKDEESDAILKLLFDHMAFGQDFQVRVKWYDGTVVLWDNRITAHTAITDYDVHDPEEGMRHGFRMMTLAEMPVGVDGLESKQ